MIKHAIAEAVSLEIMRFVMDNNLVGVTYYENEDLARIEWSSTAHGQISAKLLDIAEDLLDG